MGLMLRRNHTDSLCFGLWRGNSNYFYTGKGDISHMIGGQLQLFTHPGIFLTSILTRRMSLT